MKISKYIKILCGVFNDSYSPLTRVGFWKLFHRYNESVEALVDSGNEQVDILLKRSASTSFAEEELLHKGIRIITFLDKEFPTRLISTLGDFCPPLLYTCGDSSLMRKRSVGYVGSRSVSEDDMQWTERMVQKNVADRYGVVTGGAKGIDKIAMESAINNGGFAVVYLPLDIVKKTREAFIQKALLNGNLLIYSHVSPFAVTGRNAFVSSAMERNKFIYAHSVSTVVVRSDFEKGGTWTGAVESLKHNWSKVFVWENKNYPGNVELIKRGAIPLSETGSVIKKSEGYGNMEGGFKQLSFFG